MMMVNENYFTWEQQVALALVPKFTSSLGMTCSAFIVSELIRDHYNNEGNPINRILFGVTAFEILDSTGWFLSSWALPSEQSDFAFAAGTIGTCNFQGFLLQAAIGAPLHNCALTFFFFLVVYKNCTTVQLQALEWKVHGFIDAYAVGSAIALLSLELYNPTNPVCWVNGSPPQCGENVFSRSGIQPNHGDDFVPCDRGEHAIVYGFFCFYFLVWCVAIAIIVLNLLMRQVLIQSSSSNNSQSNRDDVRWITRQAALFSLAFFVTWGPSTVWSTMNWTSKPPPFAVSLLAAICEPLQGLWNMLIFIRNRPLSLKRLQYILRCRGGLCCFDRDNDDVFIGDIGGDDYSDNYETVQISKESESCDEDGLALTVPEYVTTQSDNNDVDDDHSELEADMNDPDK